MRFSEVISAQAIYRWLTSAAALVALGYGLASSNATAQTAFTLGNLVVNRLGDGSTTLSSTSTNITVQEFSPLGGSPIQSIAIPGTGSGAVSDSGSASSNGYLNYFADTIWVPGYQAAVGTASVTGTPAATVPRTVVPISSDGAIGTSATLGSGFTANNIRSAIGTVSAVFAAGTASGTDGGVRYVNGSNSSIRISSTVTNVRNLEIYDNELMFSTGSGTAGIYTLGGISSLDLSSADQNTASLVFAVSSPYGFFVDRTNGVAFVASDGATNTGGVYRFDFDSNSSTWSETFRLRLDTATDEFTTSNSSATVATARGLTAFFDADTSVYSVYVTDSRTSNNGLIGFTDPLTSTLATGSSFSVLATAGTNYVFRGVDLVPVPEPSTVALAAAGFGLAAYSARRRLRKTAS